jgi:hypothetical protein
MADGPRLWHDVPVTIGKGKRPRDTNQLAKFIVDVSTEQIAAPDPNRGKNVAKVDAGRKGGEKGGKARAEKLPIAQRKAIARKAAQERWKEHSIVPR